MKYLLEVCAASIRSVEAAAAGGAERIELCSALSLDGLTPSMGMIHLVKERFPQLTLHVLIRPREGNFVYNELEVATMESDIRLCREAGVDSVVVGALTPENDIDLPAMQRLMAAADGLPVTLVPGYITRYIVGRFPKQLIIDCEKLKGGYEVTLTNGLEIQFDFRGNVTHVDD